MDLFAAVDKRDLGALEQALSAGADPDERDAEPSPEEAANLRRAVHQIGDFAVRGRKLGRTPLMHAAESGWGEGVARLLAAGTAVEATDALKKTALSLAVEGGHRTVVERLLDAGANPNAKDGLGVPVLTAAFEARALDVARLLLARGASAKPRAKAENQPLSALLESFPTAEVSGVVVLTADEDEKEEIDVGEGMDLVLTLLDHGADATHEGLLDQAIMTDLPQLFELLVAAGADPAASDEDRSLFALAVSSGATRLAKKFLAEGADPNEGEGSVLMMPIAGGRVDTVRWLLEAGADPDRPINDDGDAPLMRCASAWMGNLEILSLLIEAGADLDRRNARGRTALGIAEEEGNAEAARILRQAGASDLGVRDDEVPDEAAEEDGGEGREEDAELEPLTRRRGLHEPTGNSWNGLLVRASAASLAAALAADEAVESVAELAVGEDFAEPPSDVLVLLELAGHSWTHVACARRPEADEARWLSRAAGGRALYLGYDDTANATFYQLFENGEVLESFESTGEDFADDGIEDEEWDDEEEWEEDERLDTRFESTLRDPARIDFSEWEDEVEFVDSFLRENDAYAPLVWLAPEGDGADRRLRLGGWPRDVVDEAAVAAVRVVVLRPRGIQQRWTKPDEATRRLREAIQGRDPEAVRSALAAGADPGAVPERERHTALGLAGSRPEIVRALLEAGANPDDAGGEPPIVQVAGQLSLATRDALETIKLLLDAGARVDRPDSTGKTALHAAATASLPGVKLLLLAGADPRRRDAAGRSPRELAALALELHRTLERKEIVSLLERAEGGMVEIRESAEELVDGATNPYAGLQERLKQLEGLGELFSSLSGAAEPGAAGDTPENPLGPPEVHLSGDPEPPDAAMERDAAALEALGYVRAGSWVIDEMPGVRLVGLVHRSERLAAAVYRHPAVSRPVCDVVSRGPDGTSLTVGNTPLGGERDQRPGARKLFLANLGPAELHRRALDERAVAVGPEGFREQFETMYQEDMDWRRRRGVTDQEVRKAARRGGG